MATRKLGDTIYLDFTTHNPTSGVVVDADSGPTCEVFEDDNDTAILSPAVTKRTSKTGDYRVPIEATSDNGFEVGKSYNVIVSATVGGVAVKSRIGTFTLDSKRIDDLNDLSQSDILSDATPISGVDFATVTLSVAMIKKIQTNKWKILNNQLIIYDDNGTDIIAVFDLKDSAGNPSESNVYERDPTTP